MSQKLLGSGIFPLNRDWTPEHHFTLSLTTDNTTDEPSSRQIPHSLRPLLHRLLLIGMRVTESTVHTVHTVEGTAVYKCCCVQATCIIGTYLLLIGFRKSNAINGLVFWYEVFWYEVSHVIPKRRNREHVQRRTVLLILGPPEPEKWKTETMTKKCIPVYAKKSQLEASTVKRPWIYATRIKEGNIGVACKR